MLDQDVRGLWFNALPELGVEDPMSILYGVLSRYEEPHRFYHTQEHIAHLLDSMHLLSRSRTISPPLVVAGVYHDCVYEIGAPPSTNEIRSALVMLEDLGEMLPNYVLREISNLIVSTFPGDYKNQPKSLDEAILRDADLAGFVDHRVEKANSLKIRKEFGQFSDEDYAVGRTAFLQSMLDLPQIYWTPTAIERGWEESARANIEAALRPEDPFHFALTGWD